MCLEGSRWEKWLSCGLQGVTLVPSTACLQVQPHPRLLVPQLFVSFPCGPVGAVGVLQGSHRRQGGRCCRNAFVFSQ